MRDAFALYRMLVSKRAKSVASTITSISKKYHTEVEINLPIIYEEVVPRRFVQVAGAMTMNRSNIWHAIRCKLAGS